MRVSFRTFRESIGGKFFFPAGNDGQWLMLSLEQLRSPRGKHLSASETDTDRCRIKREDGKTESCWPRNELIFSWIPGSSHAWSHHDIILYFSISWADKCFFWFQPLSVDCHLHLKGFCVLQGCHCPWRWRNWSQGNDLPKVIGCWVTELGLEPRSRRPLVTSAVLQTKSRWPGWSWLQEKHVPSFRTDAPVGGSA